MIVYHSATRKARAFCLRSVRSTISGRRICMVTAVSWGVFAPAPDREIVAGRRPTTPRRKYVIASPLDGDEADDMPSTNIVNLDALIRRADLAAPGEAAEDITSLPVTGLAPKGFLYPALCKPDFQRETADWT